MANKPREYLTWPMITGSGSTSASPTKQWTAQPQNTRNGETTAQTRLRQLYESLELPGELADYHFVIQGCCSVLWGLRREESWVLAEIERICWLDIRLIQVYSDIVQANNDQGFLSVLPFRYLISLYEQEGYLPEALQVAEIAVKFNQELSALDRIKSRIANLESEGTS
ncbi:MAG TPA: hypothetical protein VGL94_23825 [Ktedonobacteraceae bacterium]